MKLSVIIPVLNAASTLGEQLESLAHQSWPQPWEVIVVDNGSTDGTKQIVEQYRQRMPNLHLVDASEQRGISFARNKGVRSSRGESIAFCDGDDVVAPGWVAAMGEALEKHEFVACRLEFNKLNLPPLNGMDGHPQVRGLEQAPFPPHYLNAGGGTLGVRKTLFEAAGCFDESFPWLEDHEFCFRLAKQGARLRFVPEALIHIRIKARMRGMFLQARRWGEWNIAVYKRHRLRDRSQLWCWRVYALDSARHLIRLLRIRTRSEMGNWVWQSGLQVGLLLGSIRFWAPPAPFLSHTYVEGSNANLCEQDGDPHHAKEFSGAPLAGYSIHWCDGAWGRSLT